MENKIIVVGSANTDLVINTERMPKLGETLVGSNFQTNAGGKGLNQAVAIAKLGGEVSFLGAIGSDGNGQLLLNALNEYGVNFEGVKFKDYPTGTAMITVVNGDNFIILNSGANDALNAELIEQKSSLITESEYCVLQLEIPINTVLKTIEIASKSGTKVVLNPAPFKKLPDEVYSFVDCLIPNEHEAQALTGICIDSKDAAIKAVEKIKALGVKNVVITLGHKGCVYNDGDNIIFHPAKNVTAVDTTSAGDCFIGAFVTKLSEHNSIAEAVEFATKASAIAVSRAGASVSIPFAYEIK